jgi:hypothetical protein
MARAFDIDVAVPLISGRFASEMRRCIQDIDQEIGDEAVDRIRSRLDRVLKNPTGYYRSRIKAAPRGEVVVVDDSKVVYGPWLERGRSNTRFRGYHTFEKVYEDMRRDAPELAARIVTRYVDRWA